MALAVANKDHILQQLGTTQSMSQLDLLADCGFGLCVSVSRAVDWLLALSNK